RAAGCVRDRYAPRRRRVPDRRARGQSGARDHRRRSAGGPRPTARPEVRRGRLPAGGDRAVCAGLKVPNGRGGKLLPAHDAAKNRDITGETTVSVPFGTELFLLFCTGIVRE